MGTEWQQALATGLFLGMVYALIALGFAITFGVMRIANFAHGEFVVAGMYAMILLHQDLGVPALIAIPVAALLTAALGMVFERVTVEPIAGHSHFMQMIVTLGGLIILQQIAALAFGDDAKDPNKYADDDDREGELDHWPGDCAEEQPLGLNLAPIMDL